MRPFDDRHDEPMLVLQEWLEAASHSEQNDPTAAALATSTSSGVPSVRMVLTKGADERGVRFFTNRASQKGTELSENPQAALCFHWKSLRRQVRMEGPVQELGREETGMYFHSRSKGSQIAAAVSHQSRPLDSREELDAATRKLTATVGDAEVTLPDDWTGYLLIPQTIEFWADGPDRLHDRVRFTRQAGFWSAQRLYP
jgi:pyridoxamine 5'-phosphate oxidase